MSSLLDVIGGKSFVKSWYLQLDRMYLSLKIADGRETYELRFIDAIGIEKIIMQSPLCTRTCEILMIIVDLTSERYLDQAKWFMEKFKPKEGRKGPYVVLVGSKYDAFQEKRAIFEMNPLRKFCESIDVPFYSVSAKTGENISLLMEKLKTKACEIIRAREKTRLRREGALNILKERGWMH